MIYHIINERNQITMNNEEFNPNIVTIVDEDGIEHCFEELDRIATATGRYVALIPVSDNQNQLEEGELIILKVGEECGETYLYPIEDDTEFEKVGQVFEKRLFDN